jgi:hypothetical protein
MAAEAKKLDWLEWIVTKMFGIDQMRSKRFGRLRTLCKKRIFCKTVSNDSIKDILETNVKE